MALLVVSNGFNSSFLYRCVREWETGLMSLQRSLDEWRRMIGSDDNYDHIQVSFLLVAVAVASLILM